MKGAFEDRFLRQELDKLLKSHSIDTIVETGTYKGRSTGILASTGKKVITIEVNKQWHDEAKNSNSHHTNIDFYLGSSQEVISRVIPENAKNILFFLDAHWGEYWPLLDELSEIQKKNIKPIIIIHDFFVPGPDGRPRFGYDRYKDKILNYEYVKSHIDMIFGEGNYSFYYLEDSEIDSGVAVFIESNKC